jgi:hypothetical protein
VVAPFVNLRVRADVAFGQKTDLLRASSAVNQLPNGA